MLSKPLKISSFYLADHKNNKFQIKTFFAKLPVQQNQAANWQTKKQPVGGTRGYPEKKTGSEVIEAIPRAI